MLDTYRGKAGCYDELRDGEGRLRPGWLAVAEQLQTIGPQGLQSRAADAEAMLRENGATFLVSGTAGNEVRPWQLSCVPYVLDDASWGKLESGLAQRVRLLETVLDDLLGPQRLIREGVVPPELLAANPLHARAFHELPLVGSQRLHLSAIDLARNDAGQWCVTGHRTRAPSGLGYALENRIVTSRVFQHLVHHSRTRRLAGFFADFQDHLQSLAPRTRENPRVAILTPGRSSYRYFEDVYLARYLGYTLVQGRDLAVRGNRLHLKTLSGLLPIEVLWRHISDNQCDPLEFDPQSTQGVTGMLGTVRRGTLAVVNQIGAVLVEMPALMPYLPAAQRMLFGDELELPGIETCWCGDDEARSAVLTNLDDWLIRDAFQISSVSPVDPRQLSAAARQEVIEQINDRPFQYVAQRRPQRSVTPVWHRGEFRSWHVALRSFQLQTRHGVSVLPGGLVRVAEDASALNGNPTTGQLGQDCWVIGQDSIESTTTLLPPAGDPVRLTRGGDDLPSRVAEHLFWLGRYLERTEFIARLLRVTMNLVSGENEREDLPQLSRLVAALAAVGQLEPDFAIAELSVSVGDLERELPRSLSPSESSQGVHAAVERILDNAFAVRDRLSTDAFRMLTQMQTKLSRPGFGRTLSLGSAILRLDQLVADLLTFAGFAHESLTRSHAWRFLELGRRIERGMLTAELISTTLVRPCQDEPALLAEVLRATDCIMTYRSRYLAKVQLAATLDLIVTDVTNPRSILFQLQRIDETIDQLPVGDDPGLGPDQRLAETLLYHVRMADPNELARQPSGGTRHALESLMLMLIDQLPDLSNAICQRYLIHTRSRELTGRNEPPTPQA